MAVAVTAVVASAFKYEEADEADVFVGTATQDSSVCVTCDCTDSSPANTYTNTHGTTPYNGIHTHAYTPIVLLRYTHAHTHPAHTHTHIHETT